MTEPLKLPEKTRAALAELYKAHVQASERLQGPLFVALDFLGLDPTLNHQINFETGIVTPASAPTPIREESPAPAKDEAVS